MRFGLIYIFYTLYKWFLLLVIFVIFFYELVEFSTLLFLYDSIDVFLWEVVTRHSIALSLIYLTINMEKKLGSFRCASNNFYLLVCRKTKKFEKH